MTKQEAQNLYTESIDLLKSMNIPLGKVSDYVRFKVRMSTAFGRCHYEYNYYTHSYDCWIELSENFVLNGTYTAIRNTIIHELLHTINPRAGHRGDWLHYANVVNRSLGLHIQRLDGDKTEEDKAALHASGNRVVKHQFACPTCGHIYKYYRTTQGVRDADAGHIYCSECDRKFGKKFDERARLIRVPLEP